MCIYVGLFLANFFSALLTLYDRCSLMLLASIMFKWNFKFQFFAVFILHFSEVTVDSQFEILITYIIVTLKSHKIPRRTPVVDFTLWQVHHRCFPGSFWKLSGKLSSRVPPDICATLSIYCLQWALAWSNVMQVSDSTQVAAVPWNLMKVY